MAKYVSIVDQLEDFGNSIIDAVIQDLSRPELERIVKERVVLIASQVSGRNLNNALFRPIIDSFVEERMSRVYDALRGYLDLTISEPPVSVDESASFIKEEVNTRIDSMADKLKARLANKRK